MDSLDINKNDIEKESCGNWILIENILGYSRYKCSCCGYTFCKIESWDAVAVPEECPKCGAKMFNQQHIDKKHSFYKVKIPLKLPSLNDYVKACRTNKHVGNQMKQQVDDDIMWFVKSLPVFKNPIKIHFVWVEGNTRRDYDNIAFAKKFILDAIVKAGKLKDDNRKYVIGFTDDFDYKKNDWAVYLFIEEIVPNLES